VLSREEELRGQVHDFEFPETRHFKYAYEGVDSDWDYANNGSDWNFKSCNVSSLMQAPVNITR